MQTTLVPFEQMGIGRGAGATTPPFSEPHFGHLLGGVKQHVLTNPVVVNLCLAAVTLPLAPMHRSYVAGAKSPMCQGL